MSAGRRPTTIAGIMSATAAVAVLLAAPRYLDEPLFWVAVIGMPFVLPWLTAPAALRKHNWQAIDFGHTPFDPTDTEVPDEVASRFVRATEDLGTLGFVRRGCFRSNRMAYDLSNRMAYDLVQYSGLFERPGTWEVAKVLCNVFHRGVRTTLVLQTSFADGTELVTSDTGDLPPWPRREGVLGMSFPEVRSTAELFQAHRAMVAREGGIPVRELPASDDRLIAHLRGTVEKNRAWPVSIGFYELDEARGVYRQTWKGAFWYVWGVLPPVGPIRKALRRRRARRVLRELGLGDEVEVT